jgi:hypothetical protein
VAFARGERAITVVPRLVIKLGAKWGETTLDRAARRSVVQRVYERDVERRRDCSG